MIEYGFFDQSNLNSTPYSLFSIPFSKKIEIIVGKSQMSSDRLPPQNLEAEEAILGGILKENNIQ
ncbi:MAG: hypothetical protein SWX82_15080 [Cyanobacteriota bacterium]|nr:hypothetical protein [Cyanobacteriota bacterium]